MRKFFTLVEIVAIIFILALLLSIILPNIKDFKREAIISMMNGNIKNIQSAVDMYQLDNKGLFPTKIQPSLENPQRIEFDLIYPKYIKSLPNLSKLNEQKYWVDVYGKVWGSTVDSPSELYKSGKTIEWVSNQKVKKYNFYDIEYLSLSKSSKRKISLSGEFSNIKKERIQIPFSEENGILISSIDEYGFESAPAGPDYEGNSPDWFKPIIEKEGVFCIEFGSEEIMYWDRFWTLEEKPHGTDIMYSFSVKDESGEWKEYIDDFYKLEPSKRIKIKVVMIGNEKVKPSLLDMRVDFHFEQDNPKLFIPTLLNDGEYPNGLLTAGENTENQKVYTYTPKENEIIEDVLSPYSSIKSSNRSSRSSSTSIYIENALGGFDKVNSISNIPKHSKVYVLVSELSDNPPLLSVSIDKEPLSVKRIFPKLNPLPPYLDSILDKPEIKDENWITVDGFNLFFFGGSPNEVDWFESIIEDKQPEHTRILYYYSPNNEEGWGEEYTDISLVPNSRSIKVTVVMQVLEEYFYEVEYPEFNSMIINHKQGSSNPAMNKGESLVIVPTKKNDLNKDGFYTTTLIEWDYLYESNIGDKVIEVEWSSNKKEKFISAGNYTVKLRVKTETVGWSNWSEIQIQIKESIVFSQLYTAKDFTTFDNLYVLSKSTLTSTQQTILNGAKSKDSNSKFIIPITNSNNYHTVIGHALNDNSNYYEYGQYNTKKEWSNEMSRTLSDYSGDLTLLDQKSYSLNNGYSTAGTPTRSALQGYGAVSNTETRRSIVYYYNRVFLGWGSPQYKWKATEYYRISTTVANKKLSDLIGLNNAYPTNNQHTDGYWYMRGNNIPNYKIYQLDNSYEQQSSFEPLTNTLSSKSIKLSSVLDKVKIKADIIKPSGTNFVFEISTNKTNWKAVSSSSLNGVTDITLPVQSNAIYWRIKLQSNGTQTPAVNSVVISQ